MRAFISSSLNVQEILEQLRDDLNLIEDDTKDFASKVFNSTQVKEFIVAANLRLLEQGLRPDLTPISKIPEGNQKSEFYERYTIYNRTEGEMGYEAGSQSQFIDLHKTGFFYESLKVKSGTNELYEISNDPKSPQLQKIWGEILGISGEDLLELMEIIRPKLIKFVKERLRLKLKI